jgi:hypothetical protein
MLHFVQHDTTADAERFFAAFHPCARYSDSFGCGFACRVNCTAESGLNDLNGSNFLNGSWIS